MMKNINSATTSFTQKALDALEYLYGREYCQEHVHYYETIRSALEHQIFKYENGMWLPEGNIPIPKNKNEAGMMILVGENYLKHFQEKPNE